MQHGNSAINELLQWIQENHDNDSSDRKRKYVHLSSDKFSVLMRCFQQQQEEISHLVNIATPEPKVGANDDSSDSAKQATPHDLAKTKINNYCNNAKLEDIICRLLQPIYAGEPDSLIPFLNRIDIFHQDESWSQATFVTINDTKINMTKHFSKVTEETMLDSAKTRWESPTIATNKITIDHPTYNTRCLSHIILVSVAEDLSLTIIGHTDKKILEWCTITTMVHLD